MLVIKKIWKKLCLWRTEILAAFVSNSWDTAIRLFVPCPAEKEYCIKEKACLLSHLEKGSDTSNSFFAAEKSLIAYTRYRLIGEKQTLILRSLTRILEKLDMVL